MQGEAANWTGTRATCHRHRATEPAESAFVKIQWRQLHAEVSVPRDIRFLKLFPGLQKNTFTKEPPSFRVFVQCLRVLGAEKIFRKGITDLVQAPVHSSHRTNRSLCCSASCMEA